MFVTRLDVKLPEGLNTFLDSTVCLPIYFILCTQHGALFKKAPQEILVKEERVKIIYCKMKKTLKTHLAFPESFK